MQQITNNSVTNNSSTTDQEVLVKVEGVSKKFCRSLKKSLWYGLCDIGAELNPLRRRVAGLSLNGETLLGDADSQPQIASNTPGHPPGGITNNSSALRDGEFWAVNDVSFDVQPGEVIGVIGGNGAGKSTLLKILSRITEPTSGEARIRGRVASLLEVGTGFHPELTGRENIFLNGAILGMTKAESRSKFDEIVAFAELEKFIDTLVKHYSLLVYVRFV
jgi:hypothetical protein